MAEMAVKQRFPNRRVCSPVGPFMPAPLPFFHLEKGRVIEGMIID